MPSQKIFGIIDPGYSYDLMNMEGGEQRLDFIKKEPVEGEARMTTVQNGVTNETVLAVLINRVRFLNEKMPCRENSIVVTKLEEALMWLEHRTHERQNRGVEGTHAK
jgi:hypothetical protein